MLRKFVWFLASCSFFASSAAMALGLGEIRLKSGLNQPLKAEIQLLSTQGLSRTSVKGALGSQGEFDKAGIERPFFLTRFKFETKENNNGSLYISVTSKDPVTEPFLNFLMELDWPNGRLMREYTVLLDPPVFDDTSAQQSQSSIGSAPSVVGMEYGPVQSNDTLWQIAKRIRPDSTLSVHQVMMALYRANPNAFIDDNINSLKRGVTLQIPTTQEINQYSHNQSVSQVANHNAAWEQKYAPKPSKRSASTTSGSQPSGGKLTLAAPKQDKSERPASAGASVDSTQIQQIQQEIDSSLEATAVLQKENEQLKDNLNAVLDRLDKLERLLELKDKQLAAVQQASSEAVDSEQTEPEQTQPIAEQVSETQITEPVVEDSNPQQAISDAAETEAEVAEEVTETEQAVDQGQPETKPVTSVAQTPTKKLVEEKSWLDTLMDNMLYIGIGGGAILILLIVLLVRQRSMRDASFQERLVTPAELDESLEVQEDDIPDIDEDYEDIADEHQDLDDIEDANPASEADIYIAYGKFDQAEQLLQNALAENPGNAELVLKLLECYAEMQDQSKFKQTVTEHAELLNNQEFANQVKESFSDTWPNESADFVDSASSSQLQDEYADLEKELEAFESDADADEADEELDEGSIEDFDFNFEDVEEDAAAELDQGADDLNDDLIEEEETLAEDAFVEDELMLDEDEDLLSTDEVEEVGDFDLDDSSLDNELDADLDLDAELDDDLGLDDVAVDLSEDDDAEDEFETAVDAIEGDEFDLDEGDFDDEASDGVLSNDFDFDSEEVEEGEAELSNEFDFDEDEDFAIDESLLDNDASETVVRDAIADEDVASPGEIDLGGLASSEDSEEFDVDFDFEDTEEELPVDGADAVSTKLDLARAYMDMGDVEGARDILTEVVKEAEGDALSEAETLLKTLD